MKIHRKQWLKQLKMLQPLLSQTETGKLKIYPDKLQVDFLGGSLLIQHTGWDKKISGIASYKSFFGVLNKAPEPMLALDFDADQLNMSAEGATYTIPFTEIDQSFTISESDHTGVSKRFSLEDLSFSCSAVLAAFTHEDFECYIVKEKGKVRLKSFDGLSYADSLIPAYVDNYPFSFRLSEHVVKFISAANILQVQCFPQADGSLILEGWAGNYKFSLWLYPSDRIEPLWDDIIPEDIPEKWNPMSTALGKLPRIIDLITGTGSEGKSCPVKMTCYQGILDVESLAETEISVELSDIHVEGLDQIDPFGIQFDALLIKNSISYVDEWQVVDGNLLFRNDDSILYCISTIN